MIAHRFYKGYEVDATALRSGSRFVPQVKLTRHEGGRALETTLSPPSGIGYKDEDEAVKAAMNFGFEAVDGRRMGFDPAGPGTKHS